MQPDNKNDTKSVIGILFTPDRKEVLLVKRRDVPVWTLPGGGVEKEEDLKAAIMREILEETGLTVKVRRLVGIYHPINRLAKKTHLYECEKISGQITTSTETKEVGFFPLSLLPKAIPPPYPEWITDGFKEGPLIEKTLSSVTYMSLIKHAISHPILVIRFMLARMGIPINR